MKKSSALSSKSSLASGRAGCVKEWTELAEKLSESPEVDHVQGGNFAARLETMELLDLGED